MMWFGRVHARAAQCSLLCFLYIAFMGRLYGQAYSNASSYKLEWRRDFPFQCGMVPVGAAAEDGTLWLIAHAGPGKPQRFLVRIDPSGQSIKKDDPILPLKRFEWVAYLSPAACGHSVGLLASLSSGGRDQIFEGAFFVPAGTDGLGAPIRVAQRGPQFPTLVGTGSGQFIAAGDQEPLTLMKLAADGTLQWRRSFSRNLVLPVVAVGSRGNIFVVSQGGSYILMQMLDDKGRLLRSKRLPAKQGSVVADADEGCSVLFSRGFGGKANTVYLSSFDHTLHEFSEAETPLIGRGGRTYHLISTPPGHLAIGEGPSPQQQVFAEFDRSGRLIWQHTSSAPFPQLLVPFKTGFYVIRDLFEGEGMNIDKYVY
jgi:hypothetical protein